MKSVSFPLTYNGKDFKVEVNGKGNEIASIKYNGKEFPSAIIPADMKDLTKINVEIGKTITPYINSANGIVLSPEYNDKSMSLEFALKSFVKNNYDVEIVSPFKAQKVFAENKIVNNVSITSGDNGLYLYKIKSLSEDVITHFKIEFK